MSPLRVLFLLVASLLGASCMQRVYLVQGDDGAWHEVAEAPAHEGYMAVTTEDGLGALVAASSEWVLTDGEDPLLLEVALTGAEVVVTERERPPLNLALVVDRSGSMHGAKMDEARAAARWVVERLREDDRVTLVSYATDVSVDVQAVTVDRRGRARLLAAIDGLEAAGGTHLGGALVAAAEEVTDAFDPAALNHLILVSDGRPTLGPTDDGAILAVADRLGARGVTVTTMGVGLDYHEDLMAEIALVSGGNYYYVDGGTQMAQVFGRELELLGRTVARDAVVTLELPPGVRVARVHGYRFEQRGRQVQVAVRGVAAGRARRVLLELDLPSGREGQALVVAQGRVEYRGAAGRRDVALPAVEVRYTTDRTAVARSSNRAVLEKHDAVANARAREEAVRRMDGGDRAGAQRVLEQRAGEGRAAERRTGSAAIGRGASEIEQLRRDLQAAPTPASERWQHLRKSQKARALDERLY